MAGLESSVLVTQACNLCSAPTESGTEKIIDSLDTEGLSRFKIHLLVPKTITTTKTYRTEKSGQACQHSEGGGGSWTRVQSWPGLHGTLSK